MNKIHYSSSMKSFFLIVLVALLSTKSSTLCAAEDPAVLSRLTTPIEVQFESGQSSSGTGFFFQVLAPPDPSKTEPQWRAVQALFVVTNRHVVSPERFATMKKLTFFLRRSNGNTVEWVPIVLSAQELGPRLHLHPNPQVDVAAIEVLDLVNSEVRQQTAPNSGLLTWSGVSRDNFPGVSRLQVNAGDDSVVIGYPRLLFDEFNKLPILKLGMIVTPWQTKYRNQDAFLIDYKYFAGSSGSPVVSRPTDLLVEGGKLMTSPEKQFLFLGVYSGEPYKPGEMKETEEAIVQEKIRADLGLVWYYYTVEQTTQAPAFHGN
jgi:hypothetical protein